MRNLVPHFAREMENINDLTKKDKTIKEDDSNKKKAIPVKWTEDHQRAFDKMIKLICSRPILGHFKPEAETIVYSDASSVGIGGCLTQIHDGVEKPIGFFSRGLSDAEKRYPIFDLEMLGSVETIKYFSDLLCPGKHFVLYMDNMAVSHWQNQRNVCPRINRQVELLDRYWMTVKHLPSSDNFIADFASRYPDNRPEFKQRAIVNAIVPIDPKRFLNGIVKVWSGKLQMQCSRTSMPNKNLWADTLRI